jgi:pyruvate dehydrogenase E1 component beta subunit
MTEMTYREAIRATLIEEMDRDQAVVLLGEDIGVYQGTFRVTEGLLEKYGPRRVVDTPISELGFIGAAIGMAMLGLRPVVEVMTWNFSLGAADQILQNAAKVRYFSGGQLSVPLVIRGPNGGGVQLSAQHSQSLESFYGHFPGLWVVAPMPAVSCPPPSADAIQPSSWSMPPSTASREKCRTASPTSRSGRPGSYGRGGT